MPPRPPRPNPVTLYLAGLSPGSRRTMRLGLSVACRFFGGTDPDSLPWYGVGVHQVSALRSDLADRLAPNTANKIMATVGLVPPRRGRTLGSWLKDFMNSRADLKPESRRKLEQTRSKLIEFLEENAPLHEITADRASKWRECLKACDLSEATTNTHVGNARTMFREAVRREVIDRSPFAHLKGGVTPASNTWYTTPEETERLLEAAPYGEWRLLIGLARLAGLRTPSETHLLT